MSDNRDIERSEIAAMCPALPTHVRLPVPVNQRLDEMTSILLDQGLDVSRSRLLAALVSTANPEVYELERIFREYLKMTAGNVVLQTRGPIQIPDRRPGRKGR